MVKIMQLKNPLYIFQKANLHIQNSLDGIECIIDILTSKNKKLLTPACSLIHNLAKDSNAVSVLVEFSVASHLRRLMKTVSLKFFNRFHDINTFEYEVLNCVFVAILYIVYFILIKNKIKTKLVKFDKSMNVLNQIFDYYFVLLKSPFVKFK